MKAPILVACSFVASLVAFEAVCAEDGDIESGRQLYSTRMCTLCHTLAGESGQMAQFGGSLDNLAAKRDAAWIRRYLKDPKSVIPNSPMPASGLTDKEISDLTAFLLSN